MSSAGIRWDADGFNAHLRAMADRADAATRQAVADVVGLVERGFKERAPVGKTGDHRRSWETVGPSQSGPGRFEARGGPTMVYSRARDLGHKRWKNVNGKTTGGKPWAANSVSDSMDAVRNGPAANVFREHWSKVHR